MIESQIIGGAAQAIGQLLFEKAKYNEEGQLLTATFAESGIPNATHMPKFLTKLANISSTNRAKGVGESPTIGVPPAAIRAMERAIGRNLTKTPVALTTITP
jgi:carbon-monoxide dehydrogenase large subunit